MVYAPDELTTGEDGGERGWPRVLGVGLVVAVAVGLITSALMVNHSGPKLPNERVQVGPPGPSGSLRPAAPSVATGPTDLVVESGTFTAQGARQPVPPSILSTVQQVAGVGGARGVVRGFNRFLGADQSSVPQSPWNGQRLPTVVVSWDPGYFQLTAGRAPVRPNEVAIDSQVSQLLNLRVGGQIQSETSNEYLVVVGLFSLRGVSNTPRVTLVAATLDEAGRLADVNGYTRLDVTVQDGQVLERVREAVAAQLPSGYSVFGVNRLGTVQQMDDELLIQRAYFDLLSPDSGIRAAAVQGGQDNQQNKDLYQRYSQAAAEATLRIQRYDFQDADHATLVYEIYWQGSPSPIITAPQAGAAVRVGGVWKLATGSWCSLGNMIGSPCPPGSGVPNPAQPPAGWDAPSLAPGAVAAFTTMANPQATLNQRIAAVLDGDSLRLVIAAGLLQDQSHAGKVQFHISGVRSAGAGQEDVLYALTVTDDPSLDPPYPLIGQAVLVAGSWKVGDTYACGLSALAAQRCG